MLFVSLLSAPQRRGGSDDPRALDPNQARMLGWWPFSAITSTARRVRFRSAAVFSSRTTRSGGTTSSPRRAMIGTRPAGGRVRSVATWRYSAGDITAGVNPLTRWRALHASFACRFLPVRIGRVCRCRSNSLRQPLRAARAQRLLRRDKMKRSSVWAATLGAATVISPQLSWFTQAGTES